MESLLDSGPPVVYLLRHGRTAMDLAHRSDGWLDLPLSDEGRIGIVDAQQYLKTIPLSAIYAPPLKRTTETAHIVKSGALSQPDVVESDDAMTWNLGVLAGTRKVYGRPKVRRLMNNPDDRPLGGETYNEFKDRFVPWFDDVTSSATGSILIVCSGSNLRLLGMELFDDPDLLDLDEGGLAALRRDGDSWDEETIFGDEDEASYIS